MNPPPPAKTHFRIKKRYVFLVVVLALVWAGIIGVTGFFRLSSETTALRESLMKGQIGLLDKKITVHVGGFTTALVRLGVQFFKVPPEARAAISSIRGGEVGIYKLTQQPEAIDSKAIFQAADEALALKGWERVVGVSKEGELVAIYLPHKGVAPEHMRCCLMVLHGQDLILASARGNVASLMELAQPHLKLHEKIEHLAQR
jgi:hypothetical protein